MQNLSLQVGGRHYLLLIGQHYRENILYVICMGIPIDFEHSISQRHFDLVDLWFTRSKTATKILSDFGYLQNTYPILLMKENFGNFLKTLK